MRRTLGWLCYYARRFEQGKDHLTRAIEMNPMAEETYRVLGFLLAELGNYTEAERVLREAIALPGAGTYEKAALAFVLARAGRKADAEAMLADLTGIAAKGYVSPVSFAIVHIALGNTDLALDHAERAYAERRGWLAYLTVNPLFDGLRGNPRFESLIDRMGLPRRIGSGR